MKRLVMLAMLPVCFAQAQWRLESSTDAAPLGHGAVFVVKSVTGLIKTELKLVIFDDRRCHVRVVANADQKTARSLEAIGRDEEALAVCNGGYFHAGGDFGPSGLEVAGGVRTGTFTGGAWVGALMVRKQQTSLVWENEFRDSPDITEFIQCSPWLVSGDSVFPASPSVGPEQRNHRTFIMTDGQGRWGIGVCKSAGLSELARILITPGIITEMKVKRALNLDGGPSTGLRCRREDGREHFEKPGWAVRNAIVIVPSDSK
jgi:hypothetical protein